jgi:hypothetical protein
VLIAYRTKIEDLPKFCKVNAIGQDSVGHGLVELTSAGKMFPPSES